MRQWYRQFAGHGSTHGVVRPGAFDEFDHAAYSAFSSRDFVGDFQDLHDNLHNNLHDNLDNNLDHGCVGGLDAHECAVERTMREHRRAASHLRARGLALDGEQEPCERVGLQR